MAVRYLLPSRIMFDLDVLLYDVQPTNSLNRQRSLSRFRRCRLMTPVLDEIQEGVGAINGFGNETFLRCFANPEVRALVHPSS